MLSQECSNTRNLPTASLNSDLPRSSASTFHSPPYPPPVVSLQLLLVSSFSPAIQHLLPPSLSQQRTPSTYASACVYSPAPPSCAFCLYRLPPAAHPQTVAIRPPPPSCCSFVAAPASASLAFCTTLHRCMQQPSFLRHQLAQIKNHGLRPSSRPARDPALLPPLLMSSEVAVHTMHKLPQAQRLPFRRRLLLQLRLLGPVPQLLHSRNTHLPMQLPPL